MAEVTLTVRFIRSFEHRNIKHLVFRNVDLHQSGKEFLDSVMKDLLLRPGVPPPVKKYMYDTLKIEHKPHKAKTVDPVINTQSEEVINLARTLEENGVVNETEISCFKLEDYNRYKSKPVISW